MATLYVARSKDFQEWASDVGLTAHLYKVGVAEGPAEAAVEALNAAKFCGASDWRLVTAQEAEIDEATALERIGRKEKLVDPAHYPRLGGGAAGIVKVKIANVQSRILVQRMMAGEEEKAIKPKPADIAAHLMQDALG